MSNTEPKHQKRPPDFEELALGNAMAQLRQDSSTAEIIENARMARAGILEAQDFYALNPSLLQSIADKQDYRERSPIKGALGAVTVVCPLSNDFVFVGSQNGSAMELERNGTKWDSQPFELGNDSEVTCAQPVGDGRYLVVNSLNQSFLYQRGSPSKKIDPQILAEGDLGLTTTIRYLGQGMLLLAHSDLVRVMAPSGSSLGYSEVFRRNFEGEIIIDIHPQPHGRFYVSRTALDGPHNPILLPRTVVELFVPNLAMNSWHADEASVRELPNSKAVAVVDDETLYLGQENGEICLHERGDIVPLDTLSSDIAHLKILPTGALVAADTEGNILICRHREHALPREMISMLNNEIRAMALLPSGEILIGGSDGKIRIWDGQLADGCG